MQPARGKTFHLPLGNAKEWWKALFMCVSVAVFTYIFILQIPGVISRRYLFYSFLIGLAAGGLYLVVSRYAALSHHPPDQHTRLRIVLSALAYTIASILLFGLPNNYLLAPRAQVRIEIPAEKEGGASLRLDGISNGMGYISFSELQSLNARLEGRSIILEPQADNPALITWSGKAWSQVSVELSSDKAEIPINLTLNGKREVLGSENGAFTAYLKPTDFWKIKTLSDITCLIVLESFFISVLIILDGVRQVKNMGHYVHRVHDFSVDLLNKKQALVFWIILLVGAFVRIYRFGEIPGGLHVDEAMAGYQAWSLLNYGVDHFGYRFPVYFVAVGGGMNALEIYLMMPFVSLLGLNNVAIRLPQVLLGIATIVVFYHTAKYLINEKFALVAMALLAINPWHIMMSRWALESNLLPFFLLSLVYLLSRSLQDKRFFIPAGIFAGIGMYAYALGWVPILILLLVFFFYEFLLQKNRFTIHHLLASVSFLVLVFPLFLFVLVNLGYVHEIQGIISIPKLTVFRNDEVSNTNLIMKISEFTGILVRQNDGLPWNFIKEFGLYYKFGLPLIGLGLVVKMKKIYQTWRKRENCRERMMWVWLAAACAIPMMTKVNIIRANSVWLPLIYFCGMGVFALRRVKNVHLLNAVFVLFFLSFIRFGQVYFLEYPAQINEIFAKSVDQALKKAQELTTGQIFLSENVFYSRVMFYDKIPPLEFKDSVVYETMNSRYLKPLTFGRYINGLPEGNYPKNAIYVVKNDELEGFENQGFKAIRFEFFSAVYHPVPE